MIENLLSKNEGKTLEFKENAQSLHNIVKTVIAFGNTAGGIIVIGVKGKVKRLIGVKNTLQEEERLTNAIAESILPLVIPDIEIQTYRNKEIILIHVYHGVGPYYLKSAGLEKGVYVRFGSTNRLADAETIYSLRLLAQNISFDQLPYIQETYGALDWPIINKLFQNVGKTLTEQK